MSARQEREARAVRAVAGVSGLSVLPAGRIDVDPAIRELLTAADELARHSELELLGDRLKAAAAGSSEAGELATTLARLRGDDRFVQGHGSAHLWMSRVDFTGHVAEVAGRGWRVRPTAAGSLVPEPTAAGETVSCAFAAELQVMVPGDQVVWDSLTRELEERNLKLRRPSYGLQGQLLGMYSMGGVMRAAWGAGTVALTDRRFLGLIFDDAPSTRPRDQKDPWMPSAFVAEDASSLIVFEVPLVAITEVELLDRGMVMSRLPYANVSGDDFDLSVNTFRLVERDLLVRPKKGVLSRALASLASRGA